MRASASCPLRPCPSIASHTASWASWSSAQSACASVTPTAPISTRRATSSLSRSASINRVVTHDGFLPRTWAMPLGPSPSSWRIECTTRASSIGVSVRGGRLASSRATFCSKFETVVSRTAGTHGSPDARHLSRRLKPSMTSYSPSAVSTTRSGSSLSRIGRSGVAFSPARNALRLVPNRSTGTNRIFGPLSPEASSPGQVKGSAAVMTNAPSRPKDLRPHPPAPRAGETRPA
jgi:hypothetical protein